MAADPLSEIKHIICVASGKGGVGKSTTAVNLALSLLRLGLKTGVLDADIYGPSIPHLLGIEDGSRPQITPDRKMVPMLAHGLQCNSVGLLVDAKTAMVWRAPMIISAFNQILGDTAWDSLDCLVVDLPPGTGDIQLSLAQNVSVSGAVIVTTPQDLALLDARKGIEMFGKVSVPVLGVVENMSTHICSSCGAEEAIFGEGGGKRLADEYSVPVLGRLPLALSIRECSDSGEPIVVAAPESREAESYLEIAKKIQDGLIGQSSTVTSAPTISIVDD